MEISPPPIKREYDYLLIAGVVIVFFVVFYSIVFGLLAADLDERVSLLEQGI